MAEIHAIQNGNWADASTWDLGRVPDVDDDVYIDDYNVNTLSITTIQVKTLYFTGTGTIRSNSITTTYICNIIADGANPNNGYCMKPYGQGALSLIGDATINLLNETHALSYYQGTSIGNFISYSGCLFSGSNATNLNWTGNMYLYNRGRVTQHQTYGVLTFQLNGLLYVDANSIAPYVIDRQYPNYNKYIARIESYSVKPIFRDFSADTTHPFIIGEIKLYNATYMVEESEVNNLVVEGDVYIPNGTLMKSNYIRNLTFKKKVTTYQFGAGFGDNIITENNSEFVNLKDDANTLLMTKIQYDSMLPQESDVREGVQYGADVIKTGTYTSNYPQESTVLKDVHYGDNQVGTLEVIALSGATATAENISVVNLTEDQINRVSNCATVSTVQKCFEDFKE